MKFKSTMRNKKAGSINISLFATKKEIMKLCELNQKKQHPLQEEISNVGHTPNQKKSEST